MIVPMEAVMDIAKLAKEIGNLQYETEYRFESGMQCLQTLREGDLRGILNALRDRGFIISRENEARVESPSICTAEHSEQETAA
jgi:hypothetical protein